MGTVKCIIDVGTFTAMPGSRNILKTRRVKDIQIAAVTAGCSLAESAFRSIGSLWPK